MQCIFFFLLLKREVSQEETVKEKQRKSERERMNLSSGTSHIIVKLSFNQKELYDKCNKPGTLSHDLTGM